jgi:hypothetical protein
MHMWMIRQVGGAVWGRSAMLISHGVVDLWDGRILILIMR